MSARAWSGASRACRPPRPAFEPRGSCVVRRNWHQRQPARAGCAGSARLPLRSPLHFPARAVGLRLAPAAVAVRQDPVRARAAVSRRCGWRGELLLGGNAEVNVPVDCTDCRHAVVPHPPRHLSLEVDARRCGGRCWGACLHSVAGLGCRVTPPQDSALRLRSPKRIPGGHGRQVEAVPVADVCWRVGDSAKVQTRANLWRGRRARRSPCHGGAVASRSDGDGRGACGA